MRTTDLEANWKHATQMWTSTCEEAVGKKTAQHKEWITPFKLPKIGIRKDKKAALNNNQTRVAKEVVQEEYNEAHREMKRYVRAVKGGYIDNLARQAEAAATQT